MEEQTLYDELVNGLREIEKNVIDVYKRQV